MRKNWTGFIIIKFVPQMPKQVKCIGHIYPVATGSSPGKAGGGSGGQSCVNVTCYYKAGGKNLKQIVSKVAIYDLCS